MGKGAQCTSVFPTKGGFVFCQHRLFHPGHHRGYRKMWKTCDCIIRQERFPAGSKCSGCGGLGVIEVKKDPNEVRLTDAQLDLLLRSTRKGGAYAVYRYAPVKKLSELGFIDDGEGNKPNQFSTYWFVTEAGKKWLRENGQPEGEQ